ncbi:hypothetical protein BURPS1710b_3675 [Burkholderia pseudomallei 1710b]|uniref:Uncharacterized protein n=1 Tax=Burkholderia pseudomallei (strain 1710b) TaxID=320372 RepID=Q3JN14_BURP1|nr:hypothetical protein BURPS1710b_3675 [Burkholderia pseudomallei 1710b]
MGFEPHAFRRLLEGAERRPERHAEEEREVHERAYLGDQRRGGRRRSRAEERERQEHDNEDAEKYLVEERPVADRLHRAAVEPRQEEQRDDGPAHHDDAPELRFREVHEDDERRGEHRQRDLPLAARPHERKQPERGDHDHQHDLERVGRRAQHRVERGEVPDGRDLGRRLQRVRRDEVVRLEEVAAHLRHEEHDQREHHQEHADAEEVVHRVVRMERNAVERHALLVLLLLDLDAVRVVRPHFVQRDQVRDDEQQQHERNRDHVEREEAVQRDVGHDVVAANPQRQVRADERNRREQVHDHLRAPERHLAPRQQVAEERLGHQAQEDRAAEDPHEFARLAVRAVQEAAEHVQVDDDEEHRRARRVQVADQPAPRHLAHDVLDRRERERRIGLVVHRQEDARDDLVDEHEQRERPEEIPHVEILRRVILGKMLLPRGSEGKAPVDPAEQACCGDLFVIGRHLRFSFLVLADHERRGRREHVWRDVQILRSRLVLEDPSGEIVGRTVARAEEAARPVVGQVRLRPGRETLARRAAEMRAHRHHDQDVLAVGSRPVFVRAILGQRHRVRRFRLRIGDFLVRLDDVGEHRVGAVQHPHRLAAPRHREHLAGLERADVDFDGRAGRLCLGGRRQRRRERYHGCDATNAARNRCRNQPCPAAAVDVFLFFVSHHTPQF